MSEYRTLFDARGARYNRANRLFPGARSEEAAHILAHLAIGPRGRWLDVGAGGGFLADCARAGQAGRVAFGCDESVTFLEEASSYALRVAAEYEHLPFENGGFSAAGCLAVLHHAARPDRIAAEMLRVTMPGGRAAIGDVLAGSLAARFLNEFVDEHTDQGHAGRYFQADALAACLRAAGGRDVRGAAEPVRWRFVRRDDAQSFCRELFGLRPDTGLGELEDALDALGLHEAQGEWLLPWDMVFASAVAA